MGGVRFEAVVLNTVLKSVANVAASTLVTPLVLDYIGKRQHNIDDIDAQCLDVNELLKSIAANLSTQASTAAAIEFVVRACAARVISLLGHPVSIDIKSKIKTESHLRGVFPFVCHCRIVDRLL